MRQRRTMGLALTLVFAVCCRQDGEPAKTAVECPKPPPQPASVERLLQDRGRIAEAGEEAARQYDQCVESALAQCAFSGISAVARIKADPAACRDLKDDWMRRSCEMEGARAAAFQSKDPAKCDGISAPEDRDRCTAEVVGQVALEQDRPEMCAKIRDEASRIECQARVFETRAARTQDVAACAEIPDPARKADCQQRIALQKAMTTAGAGACDVVEDPTVRETCRAQVLREQAAREGKPEVCKGLQDPVPCRDAAYYRIAVSAGDPEKCRAVVNALQKDQCLIEAGREVAAKDPAFCGRIAEPAMRRHCFNMAWSGVASSCTTAISARVMPAGLGC